MQSCSLYTNYCFCFALYDLFVQFSYIFSEISYAMMCADQFNADHPHTKQSIIVLLHYRPSFASVSSCSAFIALESNVHVLPWSCLMCLACITPCAHALLLKQIHYLKVNYSSVKFNLKLESHMESCHYKWETRIMSVN